MDRTYPDRLMDPEGEGIYLRQGVEGLREAALIFYEDARRWREVGLEVAYLRPGKDNHWYHASIGKHPRGWRLNLPKRWCPVTYLYYTPKRDSQ